MLKLKGQLKEVLLKRQPPSGGCVLKRAWLHQCRFLKNQPPSGGCVLKRAWLHQCRFLKNQPPSGGCVLKHGAGCIFRAEEQPAAFRRLCVETSKSAAAPLPSGASRLQAAVC